MRALGLALRDLRHDLRAFLALSAALAAILAPLLVLLALKTGVVAALLEELRRAPDALEVEFLGDYTIAAERFAEIAALPEVGFVAALPRGITLSMELEGADLRLEPAGLKASGPGDPLLAGTPPPGPDEIVLSPKLAAALAVEAGGTLVGVLRNNSSGVEHETPLRVAAVSRLLSDRWALVHERLAFAAQAVSQGDAVPELRIPGDPPPAAREVARLRLYATRIEAVPALAAAMRGFGYDVDSDEEKIRSILRLERNLDLIFLMIATLAGLGYMVALGVSLWVNVERKRRSLAMLRLMGTPTRTVVAFPLIQGGAVAALGVAIAGLLYLLATQALNAAFAGSLPGGAEVASLPASAFASAAALTVLGGVLAAGLSGYAAARLQPMEALRDV